MENVSPEGQREIARTNWWLANRGLPPGNPDLLFNPDGTVRLPKLVSIAISWAAKSHGCLTRQPTRERAEAVMAALVDRVAAQGMTMETRPGSRTDTFGVYLVKKADEMATQPAVASAS